MVGSSMASDSSLPEPPAEFRVAWREGRRHLSWAAAGEESDPPIHYLRRRLSGEPFGAPIEDCQRPEEPALAKWFREPMMKTFIIVILV